MSFEMRSCDHVGILNVKTPRGELQARGSDVILRFPSGNEIVITAEDHASILSAIESEASVARSLALDEAAKEIVELNKQIEELKAQLPKS